MSFTYEGYFDLAQFTQKFAVFVDMVLTHHVDSDTKLQELLDSKFEPYLLEKLPKHKNTFSHIRLQKRIVWLICIQLQVSF